MGEIDSLKLQLSQARAQVQQLLDANKQPVGGQLGDRQSGDGGEEESNGLCEGVVNHNGEQGEELKALNDRLSSLEEERNKLSDRQKELESERDEWNDRQKESEQQVEEKAQQAAELRSRLTVLEQDMAEQADSLSQQVLDLETDKVQLAEKVSSALLLYRKLRA